MKKEICRGWKQQQGTQEEYTDMAQERRDGVRKAKAQRELEIVRDTKGKKGFCKHVGSKGKAEKNVDPQLRLAGKLVTKDMDKAQVLSACFALCYCSGLVFFFFLATFVFRPSRSLSPVAVCGRGALKPVGHTQILGMT